MSEHRKSTTDPICDKIDDSGFRQVRCPEPCGRLLFLAALSVFTLGFSIEIKCPRCGNIIGWPVLKAEIIE